MLAEKVAHRREEEHLEREVEEQRLRGTRWDDGSMEMDEAEGVNDDLDEDFKDDEEDLEEIRRLKVSRVLGLCCQVGTNGIPHSLSLIAWYPSLYRHVGGTSRICSNRGSAGHLQARIPPGADLVRRNQTPCGRRCA